MLRLIILLIAGTGLINNQYAMAQKYGDCHFHLLDFLQNGEFDNRDGASPCDASGLMKDGRYFQLPYGERHRRLTGLLYIAEKHNIENLIVYGMPFVKKMG